MAVTVLGAKLAVRTWAAATPVTVTGLAVVVAKPLVPVQSTK